MVMNRSEAESQITNILRRLELDSGLVVENICLQNIDVTEINSPCKQYLRRVFVEFEPVIKRSW